MSDPFGQISGQLTYVIKTRYVGFEIQAAQEPDSQIFQGYYGHTGGHQQRMVIKNLPHGHDNVVDGREKIDKKPDQLNDALAQIGCNRTHHGLRVVQAVITHVDVEHAVPQAFSGLADGMSLCLHLDSDLHKADQACQQVEADSLSNALACQHELRGDGRNLQGQCCQSQIDQKSEYDPEPG